MKRYCAPSWKLWTALAVCTATSALLPNPLQAQAVSEQGNSATPLCGEVEKERTPGTSLPGQSNSPAPRKTYAQNAVVISPDGRFAYVANTSTSNVSVVDTTTLTELALIKTGNFPEALALNTDGSRLYSANFAGNSISVIDTNARKAILEVPVGRWPISLALSPDGKSLFVANEYDHDVIVLNTDTYLQRARYKIGQAESIALSPDGRRLYSAGVFDRVRVFNADTGAKLGEIPTTEPTNNWSSGIAIAPKGKELIVETFGGDLQIITLPNGRIRQAIPLAGGPTPSGCGTPVCVDGAGHYIYAVNSDHKTVSVLDARSGARIIDIPDPHSATGSYPVSLAVSPDNSHVFVVDSVSLWRINTSTNAQDGIANLSAQPFQSR